MNRRQIGHQPSRGPTSTAGADATLVASMMTGTSAAPADAGRGDDGGPDPLPMRAPGSIDLRAIVLGLLDDPEVVAKLRRKIDLPTVAPANDYETVAETAKRYRLSTRTIRRAMAAGLPYERPVGRRVRIPVAKARAWFESGKGRNLEKR